MVVEIRMMMIRMKIILMPVAIAFLLNGCDKDMFIDDELMLDKIAYTGKELRIDGYFYLEDQESSLITATYFFYLDGTLLHGGGWPFENRFGGLESNFRSESWQDEIKENKLKWGVFRINECKIAFERWYPSSGGPVPAYIRSGKIINDTTFMITKSLRPKTGEEKRLNEVYHFREFSPKPDSSNKFIN